MRHLEEEELVPSRPIQSWHVRRVGRRGCRHLTIYFYVLRMRVLVEVPVWCQVGLAGHHHVWDPFKTPQLCKRAVGPI